MAKSVEELLRLQEGFVRMAESGLKSARLAGRKVSLDGLFEAQLVLGQMRWRHSRDGVLVSLRDAVATARLAMSEPMGPVSAATVVNALYAFNPAPAALLSVILDGACDEAFLSWHKLLSDAPSSAETVEVLCDRWILFSVAGLTANSPDVLLPILSRKKRLGLLQKTFMNRVALIGAGRGKDLGRIESLFVEGGALFNQRAKNGFYSGGKASAGGGPDNEHVVDLELAALARWCGPAIEARLRDMNFPHVRTWA